MSQKTQKIIYLAYGIIMSVLLVTAGVCLIVSCLNIYTNGGEEPFSREIVERALAKIAVPLWLCVGGVAVGILLTLILPAEKDQKIKGRANPQALIRKLMKKVDVTACPPSLMTKIRLEKTARRSFGIGGAILSLLFSVPAIICFVDPTKFVMGELDPVVTALCFTVLGGVLALCGWIAVSFLCAASLKRELALVKEAVKMSPLAVSPVQEQPDKRKKDVMFLWVTRGVVFVAAVVLIICGVIGGGVIDVFENAIKICTSCIGLG